MGEMIVQSDDLGEPGAELEVVKNVFQGRLGISREQRLGVAGIGGGAEELFGAGM